MIKILLSDINSLSSENFLKYIVLLPPSMRDYINKSTRDKDRKSKLIARLMLLDVLYKEGLPELIGKWNIDNNRKPFIPGWFRFNISHSGHLVALAYGSTPLGLDIEQKIKTENLSLIKEFHFEEQERYLLSGHKMDFFWELWVKKESFLKAQGVGIVNGLNNCSVLKDEILFQNSSWYLRMLNIHPEYKCCICTSEKIDQLNISWLNADAAFHKLQH